jgi:hypothetical protein
MAQAAPRAQGEVAIDQKLKREIARAVLTRQAARAGVDRATFARQQAAKVVHRGRPPGRTSTRTS